MPESSGTTNTATPVPGNETPSSDQPKSAVNVANPGSPEAKEQGCKCPVFDNHHGRGYFGQPGIFAIAGHCPIHTAGEVDDA